MAVLVQQAPRIEPLVTTDARFPEGVWYAQAQATGDATGGSLEVRVNLATGRLWSYEDFNASCSAAVTGRIVLGHGKVIEPSTTGFLFEFAPVFIATDDGVISLRGETLRPSPGQGLWIFKPDTAPAALLSVANVAGRVIRLDLWGYLWSLEALKEPNGPLRPRAALTRLV